ncbi:hypothetical protein ACXPWS_20810 [Mycobacterium sp. BMJ-28]
MRLSKLTAAAAGSAAIAAAALLVHPLSPGGGPVPGAPAEVVLMSGSPGSPPAPSPGAQAAKGAAAAKWQTSTQNALKRLNHAIADFQTAMDAQNFPGMKEACGRVGTAGRAIAGTLPAPVQDVTEPMEAAASNFIDAGTQCDNLTPEGGRGPINIIVADVQSGMSNVRTAQAALAAASSRN